MKTDPRYEMHNSAWDAGARWILDVEEKIKHGLYKFDLTAEEFQWGYQLKVEFLVAFATAYVHGWLGYESGEDMPRLGEFADDLDYPDANTDGYILGWGRRAAQARDASRRAAPLGRPR